MRVANVGLLVLLGTSMGLMSTTSFAAKCKTKIFFTAKTGGEDIRLREISARVRGSGALGWRSLASFGGTAGTSPRLEDGRRYEIDVEFAQKCNKRRQIRVHHNCSANRVFLKCKNSDWKDRGVMDFGEIDFSNCVNGTPVCFN